MLPRHTLQRVERYRDAFLLEERIRLDGFLIDKESLVGLVQGIRGDGIY